MKHEEEWMSTKEILGVPVKLLLKGRCSGRKGILQQNINGTWRCICISNKGTPLVLDCEHEALEALREVMTLQTELLRDGIVTDETMPRPHDFRFVHVDVEPEEIEVSSTDEACEILATIASKGSA